MWTLNISNQGSEFIFLFSANVEKSNSGIWTQAILLFMWLFIFFGMPKSSQRIDWCFLYISIVHYKDWLYRLIHWQLLGSANGFNIRDHFKIRKLVSLEADKDPYGQEVLSLLFDSSETSLNKLSLTVMYQSPQPFKTNPNKMWSSFRVDRDDLILSEVEHDVEGPDLKTPNCSLAQPSFKGPILWKMGFLWCLHI